MASRSRSVLAPIGALALALVAVCHFAGYSSQSFVPAAAVARKAGRQLVIDEVGAAATAAALATAATAPLPVVALEEDEEGFDIRILAVLALPLTAVSWALFNVWRVAFRQVVRIGDSASGSSKAGLRVQD